ncbi:hypothetical protein BVRB_032430, partial [Beta vulgaris subsp. vulgaris]
PDLLISEETLPRKSPRSQPNASSRFRRRHAGLPVLINAIESSASILLIFASTPFTLQLQLRQPTLANAKDDNEFRMLFRFFQAMQVVDFLHQQGVVHGCLRPDRFSFDPDSDWLSLSHLQIWESSDQGDTTSFAATSVESSRI